MSHIRNPPPSEWPRIYTIDFLVPSREKENGGGGAKSEWHTFQVGKTRGPEGDNSVVHSVRPEIVGGVLTFFIYYTVRGSEMERFWQEFAGIPHRTKFDTRESLSGGGHAV